MTERIITKNLLWILTLCIIALFTTASTQERRHFPLNLGYSAISGSFAPLWVGGYEQGLVAKHGVDMKMAYIQGNRVMLSALTAGEIHMYQGGPQG